MRVLFVFLLTCSAIAGCSLRSPSSEAHSNMLGITSEADFVLLGCPYSKDHGRCRGGLVIHSRAILLRKDLLCVRPREPC